MKTFSMLPEKNKTISFNFLIKKKQNQSKFIELYKTKAWQRLRLAKLQDNPLCEYCLNDKFLGVKITVATIADHSTAHKGDRDLFFNYDNLKSSCKRCHNRKSQRERGAYVKR